VPNGVIKSAVAAEWRWENYRIGKPPPLAYKPIEFNAARRSSNELSKRRPSDIEGDQTAILTRKPSLMRRASLALGSPSLSPSSTISLSISSLHHSLERSPRLKNLKSIALLRTHSVHSNPFRPPHEIRCTPSTSSSSESMRKAPNLSLEETADFGLSEGFDTFDTDPRLVVPSGSISGPRVDATRPNLGPALTEALMQASHAECEPGTTADLLSVVLGRDSRPSGFSYTNLNHPCRIWWGTDDDKISEKSMRWLEKTVGAELRIVEGEGHNLMTCSGVMIDVFKSLAKDAGRCVGRR